MTRQLMGDIHKEKKKHLLLSYFLLAHTNCISLFYFNQAKAFAEFLYFLPNIYFLILRRNNCGVNSFRYFWHSFLSLFPFDFFVFFLDFCWFLFSLNLLFYKDFKSKLIYCYNLTSSVNGLTNSILDLEDHKHIFS